MRRVPYKRTMAIRYSNPESSDWQVVQLQRILANTQTDHRKFPLNMMPKFGRSSPSPPLPSRGECDEVYPGLFVGDEGAAKNKQFLKLIGVTHIVNSAEGNGFTQIDTGQWYYSDVGITYLGLPLMDVPQAQISIYFQDTANFIDKALKEGGKVLIHCLMGISRSATLAVAYLMIKRNMTVEEALRRVRRHRRVRPNDGFLRQLINLDLLLRGQRK